MGFFDNIGKTLSNAGQTIAQKSKDVVDTAKLNSAISDEQKIITNAYEKIGRLYVERHADYPEPDFVEYLDEIKAAQNACEFPYKSRVMGTSEPLKPLKAPYMARNPVKWVFFRLKGQEIPLKI